MSKRSFLFGFYPLLARGYKIDWDKVVSDIKDSNFTGLSLHLLSPWGQAKNKQFYPWPYENLKFNLNKRNDLWWELVYGIIRKFIRAGLDLQLCLFDRYFEAKWGNYIKLHPFKQNNLNVKWTVDKELFNSWLGGNVFTWITWDDLTTAQSGNWRPVGSMGPVLFAYVRGVLNTIREVRDEFPVRGRILLKVFNEQIAGDTDRHEIVQWVQKECRDRDLTQSAKFIMSFDYSVRGASSDAEYWEMMKGGYNGFIKNVKTEVHGVGEQYTYSQYVAHGFDPKRMLFSTDGVPKTLNKGAIQDLWISTMPLCDAKMEEADLPGVADGTIIWTKLSPQEQWDISFKWHKEYLE